MSEHVWQTELTAVPRNPLPAITIDEAKRYARYQSDTLDDEWRLLVYKASARAENLIGKTIMQRTFSYSLWQLQPWQPDEHGCLYVPLPRGPVVRAEARLKGVSVPSVLMPNGSLRVCELPGEVPAFDILEITYLAGMTDSLDDVPADLRQALANLATYYFVDEGRTSAMADSGGNDQWSLREGIPTGTYFTLANYRESVPSGLRLP